MAVCGGLRLFASLSSRVYHRWDLSCVCGMLVMLVLVSLLSPPLWGVKAAMGGVLKLTDATFEHDTQATTGATTGDWFVKFYAPWCDICRKMEKDWEVLAETLDGRVNIAEVDATEENQLSRRFGIRGFPTLLFFHEGHMYEYEGDRSVEDLKLFAAGEYANVEEKEIPPEITLIENVKDKFFEVVQMIVLIYQRFTIGFFVLLLLGIIVGLVLGGILDAAFGKKPPTSKRIKPISKKKD